MPRIRTIKPEFFTSDTVTQLPLTARLTFVGLWTYADDEGRGRDDPRLVKAALWPLDDAHGRDDVEADLAALEDARLIIRYAVGERRYFQIRGWKDHQRINRPTPSDIPACVLTEHSVSPHVQISEPSRPERKGKEGEEEEGTDTVAKATGDERREGAPKDDGVIPIGAKTPDPLHQARGEAAALIRLHLWKGDTPPDRCGAGWTMGRELSVWNNLVKRFTPEEVNGAIEVCRVALGFKPTDLLSMKLFQVEGRGDRLAECVGVWRKRETAERAKTGAPSPLRKLGLFMEADDDAA